MDTPPPYYYILMTWLFGCVFLMAVVAPVVGIFSEEALKKCLLTGLIGLGFTGPVMFAAIPVSAVIQYFIDRRSNP